MMTSEAIDPDPGQRGGRDVVLHHVGNVARGVRQVGHRFLIGRSNIGWGLKFCRVSTIAPLLLLCREVVYIYDIRNVAGIHKNIL